MTQKTKYMLQCVAKVLLFVALFGILYVASREILRDKTESEVISTVMRQPNNTYDVVLVGSSHMQFAIQPAQLFGEYGIASCNVSTSAQSIPTSYYVMRDMINRHDPEVVVLDLFCVFSPDKYFSTARIHQAFDTMPMSWNKIEAIRDLAAGNEAEYFLNYLLYHNRWKSLTSLDFTELVWYEDKYQYLGNKAKAFPDPFVPLEPDQIGQTPQIPLEYLEKIVALCKETDTQLLLTVIPYRADEPHRDMPGEELQKMYNQIGQLAEEWGVGYLNGLYFLEDMNFDFMTDMVEYSHLNVFGSQKVTTFYGQYLRDNYDIPDRSEEKKYADWHDSYERYMELVKVAIERAEQSKAETQS